MERRLLLALVISLLVMVGWSSLTAKLYPVAKQEVIEKQLPIEPKEEGLPPSEKVEKDREAALDTSWERVLLGEQEFVFNLPSASIKEVLFKNYQNYRFSLQHGFWLKERNLSFKVEELGLQSTFLHEDTEKQIIKRFIFHNNNNSIELEILVKNISHQVLNLDYSLVLGEIDFSSSQLESRFQEVVLAQKDKLLRLNPKHNFSSPEEVKFLAIKDRYFCAIIQPNFSEAKGFIKKINQKTAEIGLTLRGELLSGQEKSFNFLLYLGPQRLEALQGLNPDWNAIINFGTFSPISKVLLKLLQFLYNFTRNWGVAIIMLSVFIYFILFPLSLKQMRSMKRMQELQPKIEKIRQIYKDNPQRLNREIMELYKKEKANPFSGCLPLLLQFPIFIALYQGLMRSVELKGANFLWIKDLAEPDRLFVFATTLPIIGKEFNILPVLMMIMMFFQQRFSQVASAGSSPEQQKLMMILFPLLFGFIFYHMPSGLVLYWFINTLLMLVFQSGVLFKH